MTWQEGPNVGAPMSITANGGGKSFTITTRDTPTTLNMSVPVAKEYVKLLVSCIARAENGLAVIQEGILSSARVFDYDIGDEGLRTLSDPEHLSPYGDNNPPLGPSA